MKLKLFSVMIIFLAVIYLGCGSSVPPNPMPVSKEITCIESISGKSYKYLAWGIGEDNQAAERDALKSALWGAIVGGGAGNCVALMNASERAKANDFLYNFFSDDSQWQQYVRSSNQGRIDADKRLKMSDGRVKLGIEAIVDIKMLREDLEARGVIGGMRIGN